MKIREVMHLVDAYAHCESQGNLYPKNAYEVVEWFVH